MSDIETAFAKPQNNHLKLSIIEETENIYAHFEKYIELSGKLKSELSQRITSIEFKKGELVLDANNICTKSYFINRGIMRTYYIKDGKEVSEYFSGKNEWVNSPKSFMQRQKDIYYIDAIENTQAYCLSAKDLVYFFDNFPEMERYARLSMGSVFGHFMERITSIRFTTAKEKYEHFRMSYPEIYHRIPLGMVASYLGITQETLSRIRAEK